MDLSLTAAQEMLKGAVRQFVDQEYPKETLLEIAAAMNESTHDSWHKLADTGWLGIVIPEEFGGEGGSLTDAGVLFEELGRGPVPGPHLSSGVLSALTVLEGGNNQQKSEWLPKMCRGEELLIPAITESDYGWHEDDVMSVLTDNGKNWVLNGKKAYVFDGASATHFLCTVKSPESSQVGLVRVFAGSQGVKVRSLSGFAWNMSEVTFSDVDIDQSDVLGGTLSGGWEALEKAIIKTIPILSAYQTGGCQAVYEVSVGYSRTRIQFGTPIGRFQRVQDHIINLVNQLDAARWTSNEALWKLDSGREPYDSVHLAKAVSSEAYVQACDHAHEVHAGVASMTEYGLTLHTTASRTLYTYLGDPRFHRHRLAEALGI